MVRIDTLNHRAPKVLAGKTTDKKTSDPIFKFLVSGRAGENSSAVLDSENED